MKKAQVSEAGGQGEARGATAGPTCRARLDRRSPADEGPPRTGALLERRAVRGSEQPPGEECAPVSVGVCAGSREVEWRRGSRSLPSVSGLGEQGGRRRKDTARLAIVARGKVAASGLIGG